MKKVHYVIETNINTDMEKLGFSISGGKNGAIYHAQISDKPLDIKMPSDYLLNLNNVADDEIIEAIADKFYDDFEGKEKLEFISKLASALA